jgi:hypothetical protein
MLPEEFQQLQKPVRSGFGRIRTNMRRTCTWDSITCLLASMPSLHWPFEREFAIGLSELQVMWMPCWPMFIRARDLFEPRANPQIASSSCGAPNRRAQSSSYLHPLRDQPVFVCMIRMITSTWPAFLASFLLLRRIRVCLLRCARSGALYPCPSAPPRNESR